MKRQLIAVFALVFAFALSASAAPQGKWRANHPRRAQVNRRLNRQNARIRQGVKSGKLTKRQARQLRRADRRIRREERHDAARNGGAITKRQQARINRQENRVSGRIYDDKHDGQ